MPKFVITNDAEASKLLEILLTNEVDLSDVEFKGWPNYRLHVSGEKYKQSITPSLMRPLLELQKGLYKTATRAIYNDDNTNRLTPDQRSDFEYTLTVKDGSTDANSDWAVIFGDIVKASIAKMNGKQVLIGLLSAGLLYTAHSVSTHYIDTLDKGDAREKDVAKQKGTEEAHTKQMQILADVMKAYPSVMQTRDDAEEVHFQMLKEASEADEVSMNGVTLTGEEVRSLTKEPKNRAQTATFVEEFRVLVVDTTDKTKIKVKVRGKKDEFIAAFQDDSLDSKAINLLNRHLLSREPVRLRIEGKRLSGKVINARILAVAPKIGEKLARTKAK